MIRRPGTLDREQRDEDDDGDRHDERMQRRRDDAEAFDRAQHRDRRRDHAVAVEHRRAEDAEARRATSAAARGRSMPRDTSAVSARMPPSPRLSARMISVMYFSVTTITSAQKIDRQHAEHVRRRERQPVRRR